MQSAGPTLCRSGCGFYGSSGQEGMCSKCYKDHLKQKNSPPGGRISPVPTPATTCSGIPQPATVPPPTATALPTVLIPTASDKTPSISSKSESPEKSKCEASTSEDSPTETSPDPKAKRKNRCFTCKKKVGLTGFDCRCGGLYCGTHRYSDKHQCTFDYKNHGAEEIRKNNPVIVGEKLNKI